MVYFSKILFTIKRKMNHLNRIHSQRCLNKLNRTHIVNSYLDRVSDYDIHNKVFYIYYLGCFNNTPMYHYGESDDLDLVELKIKRTLPFYERVLYTPVEHHTNTLEQFKDYIKNKKVRIPLAEVCMWDAFLISEEQDIGDIINKVNEYYKAN